MSKHKGKAHKGEADTVTGDVLELRVHGVSNTSPASMLDLPVDGIEQVLGDNLAGFWRPKASALHGIGKRDRGWVMPGITREAYSWGGLARTSPGGTGKVGMVTSALGRIGWTLLLPFGLANVAYWTRDLGDEVEAGTKGIGGTVSGEADASSEPSTSTSPGWLPPTLRASDGAGASTVRIFGLGLTALTVVTACEMSMDLVGTQCYRGADPVCPQLPTQFNVLAQATPAGRLVLTSLVPVLLLLGLWILSAVSRSRYERAVPGDYEPKDSELPPGKSQPTPGGNASNGSPPPIEKPPGLPVLSTPNFWRGDRMVGGLAQLHLATGFALVALAVAWPALFGTGKACREITSLGACWQQVNNQPDWPILSVLCLAAMAVLLWAARGTYLRAGDVPDVARRKNRQEDRTSTPVIVAGGAVLVLTEIAVLRIQPSLSAEISLPGVTALPTVVFLLLFGLVCGAFAARLDRTGPAWTVLVVASPVGVHFSPWFAIAPFVLVLALVVYVSKAADGLRSEARKWDARKWTAWAGTGPGILLGAAFLLQGMFSSLVMLGVGDWLNGAHGANSLIRASTNLVPIAPTATDACGQSCPGPDPILNVPMPYVLFGTAMIAAFLLLLLVVVIMLFLTRNPKIEEAPTYQSARTQGSNSADDLASTIGRSEATTTALYRARRLAAIAHRAEKLMALFVLIGLTMTFLVLLVVMWRREPWAETSLLGQGTDLGTAGVAILAIAALGALVGGAATGHTRPLGLAWDLICFVPRAAHPFAPPCYAERAVPELSSRVTWWLGQPNRIVGRQRRGGRRVVLSAHSLGGVLAVAVLLAARDERSGQMSEVRLLTYGSQLRSYFGRIFPELLGPAVLGTPPVLSAQFLEKDPWKHEIDDGPRPSPHESSASVLGSLTPGTVAGWRNLWRRTDPLGFPVCSYERDNQVDRPAEEIDRTGYLVEIVAHSDYPRSKAYDTALIDLAFDGHAPAPELGHSDNR